MSEPMALTRNEKRELILTKTEKEWYAICDKIKIKRRELGVTQANLAKKLSISPSYLNLIESGKREVNVDLLLKLTMS